MSQYKELANTLKKLTHNDMGFYAAVDEAIAILLSLDAQRPIAFGNVKHKHFRTVSVIPLYAAPVAAQPQQAKPLSDSHPLAVFAQECAIGAHEYGGLRLAAQNALKAAHSIKEQAKP